jgi:hypothetical protein
MVMQRTRLDFNVPEHTKTALVAEAQAKNTTVTDLATCYIQQGLVAEQGSRLERESFPLIREAIQAEMHAIRAQMRQEVEASLERFRDEMTRELGRLIAQSSNRQVALQVKSLRETETTRRALVLLAEQLLSQALSQEIYEQAAASTSKHLVTVLGQSEDA